MTRRSALELATWSCAWEALAFGERPAVLSVFEVENPAVVVGAYQAASEGPSASEPRFARGSGGGAVRVGPGVVWLSLVLERVDALCTCSADKLLNRYVRPLLRGLTRASHVPVTYLGRDWIAVHGAPVGAVGFAHDATTGRAMFEAFVGVSAPWAVDVAGRPSFRGRTPKTLVEASAHAVDVGEVVRLVREAYVEGALDRVSLISDDAFRRIVHDAGANVVAPRVSRWEAVVMEAMGVVGAARDEKGRWIVGGDFMASADAMGALTAALASMGEAPDEARIEAAVREAFANGERQIFGVRSLASLREAIVAAVRAI